MVEKRLGGGEHRRPTGHFTVANDTNPFTLKEGLDDVAVDRDTPHILDFATGNRLTIGDQGHGFEQGPGIALRAFFPQPADPGRELLTNLQTVTGRHLHQLVCPAFGGFSQQLKGFLEHRRLGPLGLFEQFVQALERLRLSRGQQECF
ncbi:hypothetical protein D3C85_1264380 [compost metagenome]